MSSFILRKQNIQIKNKIFKKTVDKVDFLAYHDMGKFKWKNLGLFYPLEGVRVATQDDIDRAKKIFA